MKKLKYLVILNDTGCEVPVIFPEFIEHAQVCRGPRVISGGFFYEPDALNLFVGAFGKSESVGVESRDIDSKLIQDAFYSFFGDVTRKRE